MRSSLFWEEGFGELTGPGEQALMRGGGGGGGWEGRVEGKQLARGAAGGVRYEGGGAPHFAGSAEFLGSPAVVWSPTGQETLGFLGPCPALEFHGFCQGSCLLQSLLCRGEKREPESPGV